jgi:hypothetical protein
MKDKIELILPDISAQECEALVKLFLDLIAEANPLKPRGNSIVMAQKPYMDGIAVYENNLKQAINGGKK